MQDHPDYLAHLDVAIKGFAQVLAEGDLKAPVPSCPGWQLADLGNHLGRGHQWATHAIVAGTPDAAPTAPPPGRDALVQWYREAAGVLLTTLKTTDPGHPAFAYGPKPWTASIWYRRQAQETTLHLWDAVASQHGTLPIDGELARDGVDELATIFIPWQVEIGRLPLLEQAVALYANDPGGEQRWVLAGDGTGPGSAPDARAVATVTGPAEALHLLLWGRTTLDDPRLLITGDESVARAVTTSGLTP